MQRRSPYHYVAIAISLSILLVSLGSPMGSVQADGGVSFTKHTVGAQFPGAADVHATDLDGDGDVDIIGAASNNFGVYWWRNDGSESFERWEVSNQFAYPQDVYATDVDGDGDTDIVGAGANWQGIQYVVWWENNGTPFFGWWHTIDSNFSGASSVYATDIDSDGDVDVLAAARSANEIAWWENDGNQNFAKHSIANSFSGASSVYAEDVDSDGDVDILGAAETAAKISWWENDGEQSFMEHVVGDQFPGASDVHATDLDGDGDVDIIGVASNNFGVYWWRNDGSESFERWEVSNQFAYPQDVYTTDVDGDGDTDIVGAGANWQGIQYVVWWENNGTPFFGWWHTIDSNFSGASSVYATDIDSDGDVDVLATAQSANEIAWYENSLCPGSCNEPPIANAGGPYSGSEGSAIELSGSAFDPEGDTLSISWSIDSALCSFDDASVLDPSLTCADNGIFVATLTVDDGVNDPVSSDATVGVVNVAPSVTLQGDTSANEGDTISYSYSVDDPGADTFTLGGEDCGVGGIVSNSSFDGLTGAGSFDCTFSDGPVSHDVNVTVDDDDSGSGIQSLLVDVSNVAPTATFGNASPVDEGNSFSLSLSNPYDPSAADTAAGFEYAFDCGGSYGAFSATNTSTCPTDDNGEPTVKGKIRDKDGGMTEYTASVMVHNVGPTIDSITAPADPVNINDQPVQVAVAFSDPGAADTHDVTWDWGDSSSDTQVGASSPSVQDHTYGEAGVYAVTVSVTDDDRGSDTATYEFIVVYDPDGGFVTGGGWIWSEDSSCQLNDVCAGAEGKANFGFVSKYKKGASVPTGNTEFNFKAGGLNFHSDTYQWLAVTGSDYARYKGTGTINGEGDYKFMLWAGDGAPDTFRIKIWREEGDTEHVVYDNGMDQAIGGGNIVVHTK